MLSRRVGSFRPVARAGAIASIALIGMLLSANAALAATVGSAAGTVTSTSAGFDTVQMSTAVGLMPSSSAMPTALLLLFQWRLWKIVTTGTPAAL